ncbi:MAG TPA: hypothetical protein VJH34_03520 [archaeon]|nr:hypothetical protein [archaeon]
MITIEEFERLNKKRRLLKKAADFLNVREEDLPKTLERFLKELKD